MQVSETIDKHRAIIEKTIKNMVLPYGHVTLLAASKAQPESVIREAIEAGITVFGENRVQEAEHKWPALKKEFPGVQLHLIGLLQSNKVKEALAIFDVIQTLDRPKLAEVLSAELKVLREKSRHSALKTQHFYIQINTGKESQKAGVIPEDADAFIGYCKDDLKLPVVGLMCIPPALQPPAPHFALLRDIAKRNMLTELSMGMSGDYETAIRMGATCVRLGRALFGERNAEL